MDIDFSPEDMAFQQEVRAWFKAHTPSDLKRKTVTGEMLQKNDIVQWQRRLDSQGWLVTGWLKEHGGPGWTPTQRYIFDLERAAASAPVGLSMGVIMLGPVLIAFGTPEQKAQYLPRIRRCEDWWCQGYSEPGAGSDLASLRTAAVREGDSFIVNGQKIWTTLGQYGDWIFCLVRTDSAAKKHTGISFVLFDMASPGVSTKPITLISGKSPFCETFFDNVRVDKHNLVGQPGGGWDVARALASGSKDITGVEINPIIATTVIQAIQQVIATTIILFVAFMLGWFTHWLLHRFTRVAGGDDVELGVGREAVELPFAEDCPADPAAIENQLLTEREPVDSFARFLD